MIITEMRMDKAKNELNGKEMMNFIIIHYYLDWLSFPQHINNVSHCAADGQNIQSSPERRRGDSTKQWCFPS